MEKSESSARGPQVKKSGKSMSNKAKTFVPDIPAHVKFSDFNWDVRVDLDATVEASRRKAEK